MTMVSSIVEAERQNETLASVDVSAISLRAVGKMFRSRGSTVRALTSVDLEIKNQEFVCLLGPSGCGKSTILGLIAGLVQPSEGQVTIAGHSVEQAVKSRSIGLVFQDAVLLPWRTVEENAALPLEILKQPSQERRRRVAELLKIVKLDGFEKRFPHELSGGMRQRLGIARALALDPRVLLMDEPFGALDAITRDRMSTELLQIWEREHKTVVFVTHSIEEAAYLSDRIVVMSSRPGRIVAIVENELPRPRRFDIRDTREFRALTSRLRSYLEEEA